MGTYTTNKNLFMPTVGETGWGTLVNNNFSTIDTFLKPITVSGSTYTFTGNHVGNQSGGSVSATSITNSGTLTSTGKITANGGIGTTSLTTSSTITSTGKITGNGGIGTTSLTTSSTITSTGLITANGGITPTKIYCTTKTSGYPLYRYYYNGEDNAIAASITRAREQTWTTVASFNFSNSGLFSVSGTFSCTVKLYGHTGGSSFPFRLQVTENGTSIYDITDTNNTTYNKTLTCSMGKTYEFKTYCSGSSNTSAYLVIESVVYV